MKGVSWGRWGQIVSVFVQPSPSLYTCWPLQERLLPTGRFLLVLFPSAVLPTPTMKLTLFLTVLSLLLAISSKAQTPTTPALDAEAAAAAAAAKIVLTPVQTAAILKQLEQIEAQIGQGRGSIFSTALAKFRSAMGKESDALALYMDCYKLENFDRKDLKQMDFKDWRDRNEDRLKDGDFTKGLMLQLEYLVLTIQVQDIDDPKKMGPVVAALQAFMAKAIPAVIETTKHTASGAVEAKDTGPKGGGARKGGGGGGGQLAGILRQSVRGTEFSKAYQLEDYLRRKEWEYSPMNIGGIYSNVIFPYFLMEKPEALSAQWDARINAEMNLRKAGMSETEYGLYFKEQGPRFQWEKNSYLLSNNINTVVALADMLKVIRENPNHPDAKGWLNEIREAVKSASIPEPGPGPVETPIAK